MVSDTHKDYRKLKIPKGDVFIHAGDFDCYRYQAELIDFNNWLAEVPCRFKIVVAGNHDGLLEDMGKLQTQICISNAIYLEDAGATIGGIKFYGSPITPEFNNWSFMRNRGSAIRKYWDNIPKDTNVLITHGPAFGILDKEPKGEHVGCLDLQKKVLSLKDLKVHVFGHIHYSYGQKKIKGTTFINASVMNEEYNLVNEPVVIEI